MEKKISSAETKERLPWHKPEVQMLTVNLDTAKALNLQSNVDFVDEG